MQVNAFGTIILSILAAAGVSYLTVTMSGSKTVSPAATSESSKSESAYERVMRTGTLRCGYSPWPPYFTLDPNTNVLSGLSKELSDSAVNLMGVKLEYVQITNGQQVQDLNSGKIDAVCGDGPWVISTIKFIDYTKPYVYAGVYVYGRTEDKRIASFDDLNKQGISFTGLDGDLSSDLVRSHFPQAKVSTMPSNTDSSQMLLNVATNKADAVIIDPLTVELFSKNNPGKLKMLITEPVAVYGAGFTVKKGEVELLSTLNEAIHASMNIGDIARITKKYDPDGNFFLPITPPYHR